MDHELVEWAAGLPASLKLHGGECKRLLKKELEPHLPHEIMYRPRIGFSVPLARRSRGQPLKQRSCNALLEGELVRTGFFCRPYLEHLVDYHLSGRCDDSALLWTLLMFEAPLRLSARAGRAAPLSLSPQAQLAMA